MINFLSINFKIMKGLLVITIQTDEQAIEGLIVFAVLIIILIIGSLIPVKKRDTSYDTYNEIWGEQINAMFRLQTLKEMQKRSGKNYSKSITRQKKLIKSLENKLNAEGLKQKFKSNFKDVSKEEKINILEKALLNRLVARTKDAMSSRITKREFMFFVSRDSTKYYLGCNIDEFINHLESYFNENLNWTNYKSWHLDHIIPISSAKNIDEFNALQYYKNIQPLYGYINSKKSNKYDEEEKYIYLEWYFNNVALPDFKNNQGQFQL